MIQDQRRYPWYGSRLECRWQQLQAGKKEKDEDQWVNMSAEGGLGVHHNQIRPEGDPDRPDDSTAALSRRFDVRCMRNKKARLTRQTIKRRPSLAVVCKREKNI